MVPDWLWVLYAGAVVSAVFAIFASGMAMYYADKSLKGSREIAVRLGKARKGD